MGVPINWETKRNINNLWRVFMAYVTSSIFKSFPDCYLTVQMYRCQFDQDTPCWCPIRCNHCFSSVVIPLNRRSRITVSTGGYRLARIGGLSYIFLAFCINLSCSFILACCFDVPCICTFWFIHVSQRRVRVLNVSWFNHIFGKGVSMDWCINSSYASCHLEERNPLRNMSQPNRFWWQMAHMRVFLVALVKVVARIKDWL